MAKLKFEDDGSIVVPLVSGATVTLPEPSMEQLGVMMEIAQRADAALPELPALPQFSMVDGKVPPDVIPALNAYNDAVRARTAMAFGPESPHGLGLIEIIKLLVPEAEVSPATCFGWMMSPRTMKQVVEHFQSPLPGEE